MQVIKLDSDTLRVPRKFHLLEVSTHAELSNPADGVSVLLSTTAALGRQYADIAS